MVKSVAPPPRAPPAGAGPFLSASGVHLPLKSFIFWADTPATRSTAAITPKAIFIRRIGALLKSRPGELPRPGDYTAPVPGEAQKSGFPGFRAKKRAAGLHRAALDCPNRGSNAEP